MQFPSIEQNRRENIYYSVGARVYIKENGSDVNFFSGK